MVVLAYSSIRLQRYWDSRAAYLLGHVLDGLLLFGGLLGLLLLLQLLLLLLLLSLLHLLRRLLSLEHREHLQLDLRLLRLQLLRLLWLVGAALLQAQEIAPRLLHQQVVLDGAGAELVDLRFEVLAGNALSSAVLQLVFDFLRFRLFLLDDFDRAAPKQGLVHALAEAVRQLELRHARISEQCLARHTEIEGLGRFIARPILHFRELLEVNLGLELVGLALD